MSYEEDIEFIKYFKEQVIDDLAPMMREIVFSHIIVETFNSSRVIKFKYDIEEFFEIFEKHTNPVELEKFMNLLKISKFSLYRWYYGDYHSNFFIDRYKLKNSKKIKLDKKEIKQLRLYMNTLNVE